MNKETLHKLRLVIPGIILLIALAPILQGTEGIFEFKISTDSLIYFVIVFGSAGFIYVVNPRMWIMKNNLQEIIDNIKIKLLAPFQDDTKYNGNQVI